MSIFNSIFKKPENTSPDSFNLWNAIAKPFRRKEGPAKQKPALFKATTTPPKMNLPSSPLPKDFFNLDKTPKINVQQKLADYGKGVQERIEKAPPEIQFLKTVAQAVPRAVGAIERTVAQKTGLTGVGPNINKGPVGQAVFGKEPIQSFGEMSKGKTKAGATLAVGGTILDLIPGFSSGKNALTKGASTIAKSKVFEDIVPVIKKLFSNAKVVKSEEEIAALANKYVNISDAKFIEDDIVSQVKVTKAAVPKTTEEVASLAPKTINEAIPPSVPKPPTVTPVTEVLEEGAKQRKYVTSIRNSSDIADDIKSEVGGNYNVRSNEELSENAIRRLNEDRAAAKEFALANNTDEAVATRVALEKDISNKYLNTTDLVEKKALLDEAVEMINKHAELATQEGRAVQANALLGAKTPEGIARNLAREIQKYNKTAKKKALFTPADYDHIITKSDEISKMPDNSLKTKAQIDLLRSLERRMPSPLYKRIINLVKANLLTGLGTHIVNMTSTISHVGTETLKDIPATFMDAAISGIFGTARTKSFNLSPGMKAASQSTGRLLKTFKEGVEASPKGKLGKYWDGLQNVYGNIGRVDEMERLDFNKIVWPDTKVGRALESWTNAVFKTLSMEDKPWFNFGRARSMYEQGEVYIKNNKLSFSGAAAKKEWMEKFVSDPASLIGKEAGEKVTGLATSDGLIGVFQQDTMLNNLIQGAKSVPGIGSAVEVVAPFTKTPSGFASQMINYSPVGLVKTILGTLTDARKGVFDQKAFVEGISRGSIGTAATAFIGSKLYEKGKMTLGYPADEKTRVQWEAEGKIPNAIKVGDTWYPAVLMGPSALNLIAGGYFKRGMDETGSVSSAGAQALAGGAKSITEQTFLRGINAALNAINDPEKGGEAWLKSFASMIIPTISGNISQAMDEYQRKTNTVLDAILVKIPGARETVEKKIDAFGLPIPREKSAVGEIVSLRQSQERVTPYSVEINKLLEDGVDVRPTKLDKTQYGITLDSKEHTAYQVVYGAILREVLNAVVTTPGYQKLDSAQKKKVWTKIYKTTREKAHEEVLPAIIIKKYNLPPKTNRQTIYKLLVALNKEKRWKEADDEKRGKILRIILK